jgi:phosphoribosylanthranilate isomerase
VGRGTEDICEPSKSTLGVISESSSRRSVTGSTLRRWIAATTPTAVSPPSRSFYKASRRGWRFFCLSRGPP